MEAVTVGPRAMSSLRRHRYGRPSVHEVVVAMLFEAEAELGAVESAQSLLDQAKFGKPQRIEQSNIELVAGLGAPEAHATARFVGWAFQREGWPRWLVRAWLDRLTLNMMRSEGWPTGDYVGWEAISDAFETVHSSLASVYRELRPRRIGVRYLNRFSVPADSALEEWLTLSVRTPKTLRNAKALRLRHTWDVIEGHPGASVTVNLANVPTQPAAAGNETGVLLDIDIFTAGRGVPDYTGALQWLKTAHDAENFVFESCITESLRARFGE